MILQQAWLVLKLSLSNTLPWQNALAVGLILLLSSTVIILQTFNKKGLAKTEGGKSAFPVLLFQYMGVIPMLVFIPLLAMSALMEAANLNLADGYHDESFNL